MTEKSYMRSMIEVVNELQKQLAQFDITLGKQLPQIAVVGGQSAGKSSVLESFVGRDFLPRGNGIVTRRPLILQLKHNDIDDKTFAKFDHLDEKVFTDFNEIREEISLETKRKINHTGVSEEPITLTITSPDYIDLTLVDLPGMTKVPTQGQPDNIGQIIKDMILHYIREATCLILAVTPANADIATSDALEIARHVDPDGLRTIGVLTKLDIMDRGTNQYDTLIGNGDIKLRKGFIGVVNRSQQNIDENIDMKTALENEKRFFIEHDKYGRIADRQGVMYLQRYLHNELNKHIKTELPKFKDMIQDKLNDVKIRLDGFDIDNGLTRERLIQSTLTKLRKYYESEVGNDGAEVILDRDTGGVRINAIMNEQYSQELDSMHYDDKAIMKDLLQGVRNVFGTRKQIFFSNKVFFALVKKAIEKFRAPTLQCVQNVTEELNVIVDMCTKQIDRFPRLILVYSDLTKEHVHECNKKCRYMANEIIDTHEEYLNAFHVDFLAAIDTNNIKSSHEIPLSKQLPDPIESLFGNINNERTRIFAEDTNTDMDNVVSDDDYEGLQEQVSAIKDLVIAYVNIVKKTLKDVMPKTCQRYLVNAINNFIETDLAIKMQQNADSVTLDELVKGDNMEEERQQLQRREHKLVTALSTINKHLFSNSLGVRHWPALEETAEPIRHE